MSRLGLRRRFKRFVSAITGRFVSRSYADSHTTETYEREFVIRDKSGEPLGVGA